MTTGEILAYFRETYWGHPGLFVLLALTAAALFLFFLACRRTPDKTGTDEAEEEPAAGESAEQADGQTLREEPETEDKTIRPQKHSRAPRLLSFAGHRHPMERRDYQLLIFLTVVYALVAFRGLGSMKAPESFAHFDSETRQITLDLGQTRTLSRIVYYTGLWTGDYRLELSADGQTWEQQESMEQPYSRLFQWIEMDLASPATGTRYVRLIASSNPMELGEIAFYDASGNLVPASEITSAQEAGALLTDEQDTVPSSPSYLNSTYFDEIYHARTAYENIRLVYPYEVSHPPLGKLIISLGIRVFGMDPFGWRFMGTLFGVLMLPFLYVFFKNMFGNSTAAFSGTILFAFDFMHFVQTRIATIDTYGVFFILLMYFFMFRYMTEAPNAPFRKTALPLFLSGLCFGLGAASKWTAIYAGAGLFIFYVIALAERYRHSKEADGLPEDRMPEFRRYLVKTLLVSVAFFVLIPACIYCLSYLPYAQAKGEPLSWKLIWDNQVFMLNYHKNVTASHPYASRWWTWIFDARPILYYLDYPAEGLKSAFGAFGNPLVWWGGLIAMAVMGWKVFREKNRTALFILIACLSQIVPWFFIGRTTFIYHYFPSSLFLVFALTHLQDGLIRSGDRLARRAAIGFTAFALVLFILFYPVLTGIVTPTWYTSGFLRWFPSWPF